jgi:hypothetical protein
MILKYGDFGLGRWFIRWAVQVGCAVALTGCRPRSGDCDCRDSPRTLDAGARVEQMRDVVLDKKPMAGSLIQLIAYPERFQHSPVSVTGYLTRPEIASEEIHGQLHLTKDGALGGVSNYVNVYFGPCRYTSIERELVTLEDAIWDFDSYIEIDGDFESAASSRQEADFGTICNIVALNGGRWRHPSRRRIGAHDSRESNAQTR